MESQQNVLTIMTLNDDQKLSLFFIYFVYVDMFIPIEVFLCNVFEREDLITVTNKSIE